MQLLVGLGNPGDKHSRNRHNIGFMAADAIAAQHGSPPFRDKFKGVIAEAGIDGEKTLILKPKTFMNASGESVAAAMQFYKLAPADVVVVYDELDLAPGKVRIKRGGGNGGHNGLRSIDAHIGTDYRRIRLGIGHPGHKDAVTRWVLGDFTKADHDDWLDPLLAALASNIGLMLKGDDNSLMNKLALAVGGDAAERPQRPPAGPAPRAAQSHIRAARPKAPQAELPTKGPMAAMLAKVFGKRPD
ncbi:MAG TPA: aminoacyl-tRNA hydrolase [Devosia sp.]|nr:aminoacyl-tRNA hydrolase [Devosia sp.]